MENIDCFFFLSTIMSAIMKKIIKKTREKNPGAGRGEGGDKGSLLWDFRNGKPGKPPKEGFSGTILG
jgi:hypothetical protein